MLCGSTVLGIGSSVMNNLGKKPYLMRVVGSLEQNDDDRGGGEKWLHKNNI